MRGLKLCSCGAERSQIKESWGHLMRWSARLHKNGHHAASILEETDKVGDVHAVHRPHNSQQGITAGKAAVAACRGLRCIARCSVCSWFGPCMSLAARLLPLKDLLHAELLSLHKAGK